MIEPGNHQQARIVARSQAAVATVWFGVPPGRAERIARRFMRLLGFERIHYFLMAQDDRILTVTSSADTVGVQPGWQLISHRAVWTRRRR